MKIMRELHIACLSGAISRGAAYAVAPVAYQVILEPGIGQFREFESPRVHTRIDSWGLFLFVHKLTCGKRESVSCCCCCRCC